MGAIFISHSSGDEDITKALERRLSKKGHASVFLDLDPEKGIVAVQSWERTHRIGKLVGEVQLDGRRVSKTWAWRRETHYFEISDQRGRHPATLEVERGTLPVQ